MCEMAALFEYERVNWTIKASPNDALGMLFYSKTGPYCGKLR